MDFIKSAISSNLRLDGRRLDEQYELNLVPNISSFSHGSSQVSFGDSVVQTTIHFSIVSPADSAPDEGMIELSISGTNVFDNSELSQKSYELLCTILYDIQFAHSFLDLKSLCILPGQFCWNVRIHLTVVKHGGSLIDALSMGVLTAFKCSEVPSVNVMLRDELESSFDSSNLQIKLSTEENQVFEKLIESLPIVTSVGKVGKNYIWAMTKEEESCSDGTLSVAVSMTGRCLAIKSKGSCFDVNSIESIIRKSSEIALDNFNTINQCLSHP
ncbi:exosome ribonuclease PH [Theileria orientalis]|uniref:Ribosomal RNA-processing protein 42 n=1 Tax=Theileria orientalis TaxID=68886 RepID=A0A976MAE0_THEOR|nr:exosome ribonuclease PH [Theileria orientalis]